MSYLLLAILSGIVGFILGMGFTLTVPYRSERPVEDPLGIASIKRRLWRCEK
jgi:hypothetical protein